MHPRNDMGLFRTVEGTMLYKFPENSDTWLPVVRYASSLSAGQFFSEAKDKEPPCGTFYYVEPESTTILQFKRPLYAVNKTHALAQLVGAQSKRELNSQYHALGIPYGDMLLSVQNNWYFISRPSKMIWTPLQFVEYIQQERGSKMAAVEKSAIDYWNVQMDRVCYVGQRLGLYADEDVMDQALCRLATKKGYDVVVLSHMVGSRQVVQEILDVRDRIESFKSLAWIQDLL